MRTTELYNFIEDGMIHTDRLTLEQAEFLLQQYESTYPDRAAEGDFWIEPANYRF